jgi:hypothetical protein
MRTTPVSAANEQGRPSGSRQIVRWTRQDGLVYRAVISNLARTAIVAATIMILSGCRSGTSNSGWNWGWNRKNAASNPSLSNPPGPQLPSASATPPGYAPGYSATAQQGGASGYVEQPAAAGSAYPATGYPGQPAGYNNAASAPGGIPNAAAPGTNYGAPQSSATPNYGAPANNLAPQNGPYTETYGQAAGQSGTTPNAYGPPSGAYPTSGAPTAPYQAPGTQIPAYSGQTTPSYPATPAYPATAVDPNAVPPAAGNYGNPAPPAGGSYGTPADNRYSSDQNVPSTAPPEPAPANGYAATPSESATVNGAASSGPPAAERYQPGNTGYTPGNTGYSPPGVAPYQMPAQPNLVSTGERKDPYYRPGGTSDYVPGGGTRVASSAATATAPQADRYGAPATGAPADPYSQPPGGASQGYQPPASYQPPANPNGGY